MDETRFASTSISDGVACSGETGVESGRRAILMFAQLCIIR